MQSISISMIIYKTNTKLFVATLESLQIAFAKLAEAKNYKALLIILDNSESLRTEYIEYIIKKQWLNTYKLLNQQKI